MSDVIKYSKEDMRNIVDAGPTFIISNGVILELPESERDKYKKQISVYSKNPSDLINQIIGDRDDVSYLEIGVDEGETFDRVKSTNKHGVDPYGGSKSITHKLTSQMFFAMNRYFYQNTYDIIFIDGCHMAEIIEQEVSQSLRILNPGGVIILHDTVPVKESAQLIIKHEQESFIYGHSSDDSSFREYSKENPWIGYNGDSWKTVYALRQVCPSAKLGIYTAADACCTVVIREPTLESTPAPPVTEELTWDYYCRNAVDILQPVNFDELTSILNDRLNSYKDQEK